VLTAAGQTAGPGLLTTGAAALTERVLRTMWLSQLKFALVGLLGICLAGLVAYHSLAAQSPPGTAPRAAAAAPAREAPEATDADRPVEEKSAFSVKELSPAVVETVPRAGDTKVDAAKVTEIRATFSKDMTDQSWSWSQVSDETFPKVAGKIHYEKDKRTCVLPVKLEPGKTYVLWLNSEKFDNFKDADGRPAVPYLLVFETAPKSN
jgi:RNA polymerase sigma-70 factor (ECF subfamily)